jgi:hypothetical protein
MGSSILRKHSHCNTNQALIEVLAVLPDLLFHSWEYESFRCT